MNTSLPPRTDFDPELWCLFDQYVHGDIDRRAFLDRAGRFAAAAGTTAAGLLAALPYLVSKAIKAAKVVGFEDLGMEAIYEFDVVDMPVTVAVDSGGTSAHIEGPKTWQAKIGKIPVVEA